MNEPKITVDVTFEELTLKNAREGLAMALMKDVGLDHRPFLDDDRVLWNRAINFADVVMKGMYTLARARAELVAAYTCTIIQDGGF